jgi:hypothetical protein
VPRITLCLDRQTILSKVIHCAPNNSLLRRDISIKRWHQRSGWKHSSVLKDVAQDVLIKLRKLMTPEYLIATWRKCKTRLRHAIRGYINFSVKNVVLSINGRERIFCCYDIPMTDVEWLINDTCACLPSQSTQSIQYSVLCVICRVILSTCTFIFNLKLGECTYESTQIVFSAVYSTVWGPAGRRPQKLINNYNLFSSQCRSFQIE